jgi:hypothetical protein
MWRFWRRERIGRNYDDGIHRYAEHFILRLRIAIAYPKSHADSE